MILKIIIQRWYVISYHYFNRKIIVKRKVTLVNEIIFKTSQQNINTKFETKYELNGKFEGEKVKPKSYCSMN